MHFHLQGMLNFKKIRVSALLLAAVLLAAFLMDKLSVLPVSARLYVYVLPFVLHVVISIFMKQRESWIVGGIIGTLGSMAIILLLTFVL